jgi:hypothetical protein
MPGTIDVDHAEVWRAMDTDDASALLGVAAAPLIPNVTTATIARDLETGQPVYAYLPLGDVNALRNALDDLTTAEAYTVAPDRTAPPLAFGCAHEDGTLTKRRVTGQGTFDDWAARLYRILSDALPDVVNRDEANLGDVPDSYRLSGTTWTSGVVHRTTPHHYRRDDDAFPTWQGVTAIRSGVTGGYLHLPEYDATIACTDGWAAFFNGRSLVHGVTAMDRTSPYGYLNAVRYYALTGTEDPSRP